MSAKTNYFRLGLFIIIGFLLGIGGVIVFGGFQLVPEEMFYIETYYEDGKWKNRPQGNERASNVHDTKTQAEPEGRRMAKERKVEHVIKKKDGKIGERNSYGNDPYPPRG